MVSILTKTQELPVQILTGVKVILEQPYILEKCVIAPCVADCPQQLVTSAPSRGLDIFRPASLKK